MSDFKIPTISSGRRKQLMQMVTGPGDYRLPVVAKIFGKDARTLRRWCEAGHVPGAFKTPGGHWRIRAGSIIDAAARVRVPNNVRGLYGYKKDGTRIITDIPFEKSAFAQKHKWNLVKTISVKPLVETWKRENRGLIGLESVKFKELWRKVLDEENLRLATDGEPPRSPFPSPDIGTRHKYAIAQAYIETRSWRGVARFLGLKKSTFFFRYTLARRKEAILTFARLINFHDLGTDYGFADGAVPISYPNSAGLDEIRKWHSATSNEFRLSQQKLPDLWRPDHSSVISSARATA